jgi:thiamine pyrophosphate-dependent acetolactate synthase large subunit-like protein
MATETGAELLMRTLAAAGVDACFANPGCALMLRAHTSCKHQLTRALAQHD